MINPHPHLTGLDYDLGSPGCHRCLQSSKGATLWNCTLHVMWEDETAHIPAWSDGLGAGAVWVDSAWAEQGLGIKSTQYSGSGLIEFAPAIGSRSNIAKRGWDDVQAALEELRPSWNPTDEEVAASANAVKRLLESMT